MNVLLVSQCDKRALAATRRILDQFAERRGDRTWQTPITQAGLDTLRKLLRRTARKNTAVACHWIRRRDHSELLWIVGDARRFNAEGAVPTNTTVRDVLRREDENDWSTAEIIRLLARLAALLHDLGKASVAFQERLAGQRSGRNLIRHEWMSLRLFQAFVSGDDDQGWLARLARESASGDEEWTSARHFLRDGLDAEIDPYPFRNLPPLAAAVGWLIATHHRLPAVPPPPSGIPSGTRRTRWGARRAGFDRSWLETPLMAVTHEWNELIAEEPGEALESYWRPADRLPVVDPVWQKETSRIARRLLELDVCRNGSLLDNGYVIHLARLCLMLADHHYSGLGVGAAGMPVAARASFVRINQSLAANTRLDRRGCSHINQSLLEHLLGVAHDAGAIAYALPGFERHLPRLANHRGLRKRSADARFAWQDKAYDTVAAMRDAAREQGAFIVDMASTGCGKTLANARILYALADSRHGMRATCALGLRTLTLQTGRSYRAQLQLRDDELAILVGGSASRALFEYYEQLAETRGSASAQSLIDEDSHVLYEGNEADHPMLSRALHDPGIRRLVSAPMLVCTVDHMVPATESLRGGRHIAAMLRLMSSDLVLDELDDYDLADLPALTRLVYWAGILGSRIVLSSATLAPALVEGMFQAYRAGRRIFRRNRGADGGHPDATASIPCVWVHEFGVQAQECADGRAFAQAHEAFVERRVAKLEKQPALRRVRLWPLSPGRHGHEELRAAFAEQVRDACLYAHDAHAGTDPVRGRRVSFGIARMANIDPILDVARELLRLGAPAGLRIHLCVYHARFPLAQRSAMEHMLDQVLDRRDEGAVWCHPSVRSAIDAAPQCDHIFIVLASPVCEVGRDWDADWAVAEPSSMRSLIQLAGRVQRHRRRPVASPNLLVFDTNLKALQASGAAKPAFCRPGFEDGDRFLLATHRLADLWPNADDQRIDAVPRIRARPSSRRRPSDNWIDLEHARMELAMQPVPASPAAQVPPNNRRRPGSGRPEWEWRRELASLAWQYPQVTLLGVLPQQQPFRDDSRPDLTLALLPNEDEDCLVPHRIERKLEKAGKNPYVPATVHRTSLEPGDGVLAWGAMDEATLLEHLRELADSQEQSLRDAACKFATVAVPHSDQGWLWHHWLGFTPRR